MRLQISISETSENGKTDFTANVRATNCGVPDFRASFTGDSKHAAIVGIIKSLETHQNQIDQVIDDLSRWGDK